MTRRSPLRWCITASAALILVSCGADGPDGYTASIDAAPTTARTLPNTIERATALATDVSSESAAAQTPSSLVPAPPNGEVVQVRSLDNSYRLADIDVVAGTEVWWTNNGRNDHNVLPVDETQTWGIDTEDFIPGDEYRHIFDTPGTYLYYCSIHGTKTVGMVGSVVVFPTD